MEFTTEFSDKEIPFLDILIKRDNRGIGMDLYHKPTDTLRCLPYSTSHPKHCLKNIQFVMTRRICTIVENYSLKNKHLRELKENFITYGYPEKVIEIGIQKALEIPQNELRLPKTIENNNNLTFKSTLNLNNPKIFNLVKSGVNTLVENNGNGFKKHQVHSCKMPASKSKKNFNKFFIYK